LESGLYKLFLIKGDGSETYRVAVSRHAKHGSPITVECFVGVETVVCPGEAGYVLIPGVFYNGNISIPVKEIPFLGDGAEGAFEVPLSATSFPLVIALQEDGLMVALEGPVDTDIGPSGFRVERADDGFHRLAYMVPAMERKRYRHCSFVPVPRGGALLEDGDAVRFSFRITSMAAAKGIPAVFSWLRSKTAMSRVAPRQQKTQTAVAVKAVADRLLSAHYKILTDGATLFLNAFDEEGPLSFGNSEFPAECLLQTGWCNGSLTAYPLISLGEPYRQPAVEYLDFMASQALSPSGLVHGLFDGNQFYSRGSNLLDGDPDKWAHVRPSCDFITYTLRAIKLEATHGNTHPAWINAATLGLDALVTLWQAEGDFGRLVDRAGAVPVILEGGSGAGAFALLALLEGATSHLPGSALYEETLVAASGHYWHANVSRGRSGGGPLDILGADDSESAAAFAEAFLGVYRLTGSAMWLERAKAAADLFASWVYAGDASMPKFSAMESVKPRGGVLANIQNRHLGPGICVNSGRFLRDLAAETGDRDYLMLLHDIVSFAVDCVTLEDGEFFGYWRGGGVSRPFRKGMMSEQVNLGDALNLAGETWVMSFSWPMSALLLAWEELDRAV